MIHNLTSKNNMTHDLTKLFIRCTASIILFFSFNCFKQYIPSIIITNKQIINTHPKPDAHLTLLVFGLFLTLFLTFRLLRLNKHRSVKLVLAIMFTKKNSENRRFIEMTGGPIGGATFYDIQTAYYPRFPDNPHSSIPTNVYNPRSKLHYYPKFPNCKGISTHPLPNTPQKYGSTDAFSFKDHLSYSKDASDFPYKSFDNVTAPKPLPPFSKKDFYSFPDIPPPKLLVHSQGKFDLWGFWGHFKPDLFSSLPLDFLTAQLSQCVLSYQNSPTSLSFLDQVGVFIHGAASAHPIAAHIFLFLIYLTSPFR